MSDNQKTYYSVTKDCSRCDQLFNDCSSCEQSSIPMLGAREFWDREVDKSTFLKCSRCGDDKFYSD